jgi:hypothetical protein
MKSERKMLKFKPGKYPKRIAMEYLILVILCLFALVFLWFLI